MKSLYYFQLIAIVVFCSCKKTNTTTSNTSSSTSTTTVSTYTGGLTTFYEPVQSKPNRGLFVVTNDWIKWFMTSASFRNSSSQTFHIGSLAVNGNTCTGVASNGSNYNLNSADWGENSGFTGPAYFACSGNATNSFSAFTYTTRPMPPYNVFISTAPQSKAAGLVINHSGITADTTYYAISGSSGTLRKKKAGATNSITFTPTEISSLISYSTGSISVGMTTFVYDSTIINSYRCLFLLKSYSGASILLNP